MILFLNGSLGVGKTSVAHELLWRQPQTVLLEGDALCNLHPFDAYDQDRIAAQNDVSALLRKEDDEIFHFLLHCDEGPRRERIEARRRGNYLWEFERSAELQGLLLAEFRGSSLVSLVDTTDRTVGEVGTWILGDVLNRS